MKKEKLSLSKLSLKKQTVSNLEDVKGGVRVFEDFKYTTDPTQATHCYYCINSEHNVCEPHFTL